MVRKTKLNTMQFLISKALFDSNINHGEFVAVNNVLKEYDNMNEENMKIYENMKILMINKCFHYI